MCLLVCTYVCVLCFIEKGFCIRGDLCQFDHGVDAVVIDDVLPGQPLPAEQPPAVTASVPVTHSLSGPTVVLGVSVCVGHVKFGSWKCLFLYILSMGWLGCIQEL